MKAVLRLWVNFSLSGKAHWQIHLVKTQELTTTRYREETNHKNRHKTTCNNSGGFKRTGNFSVRDTHTQNYFIWLYDFPSKLKDKTFRAGKINTEEEKLILLERPRRHAGAQDSSKEKHRRGPCMAVEQGNWHWVSSFHVASPLWYIWPF